MKIEDARIRLKDFNDDDGPINLPASILAKLSVKVLPQSLWQ